jgi:heme-degrading monooxygenase HmoA
MPCHLAQINIGRLRAPIDDPQIAGFVARLAPLNALADRAPGFVWRLQSSSGNATDVPFNDDPSVMLNMSVWESPEALRAYTYGRGHVETLSERARWFEKMSVPHACLWWVRAGHIPSVNEGRERLKHYQVHGATPYAFWFSQLYPAPAEDAA